MLQRERTRSESFLRLCMGLLIDHVVVELSSLCYHVIFFSHFMSTPSSYTSCYLYKFVPLCAFVWWREWKGMMFCIYLNKPTCILYSEPDIYYLTICSNGEKRCGNLCQAEMIGLNKPHCKINCLQWESNHASEHVLLQCNYKAISKSLVFHNSVYTIGQLRQSHVPMGRRKMWHLCQAEMIVLNDLHCKIKCLQRVKPKSTKMHPPNSTTRLSWSPEYYITKCSPYRDIDILQTFCYVFVHQLRWRHISAEPGIQFNLPKFNLNLSWIQTPMLDLRVIHLHIYAAKSEIYTWLILSNI